MQDFTFNYDSGKVNAITNEMKNRILSSVKQSVNNSSVKLTNKVKSDKLSGQVLNIQSGKLKSSVSKTFEEKNNEYNAIVYTTVKYAAIHECGYKGSEYIKQHVREISQAFGKAIKNTTVTVSAHTRKVNYPERSFMRSALHESENLIYKDINDAINKGLRR